MVEIIWYKDNYTITFSGHAGAGVRGTDIVCASVSTCFYGLAYNLTKVEKLLESLLIADEEEMEEKAITCIPKKGMESTIGQIFNVMTNTLEMLALNYPDRISFTKKVGVGG